MGLALIVLAIAAVACLAIGVRMRLTATTGDREFGRGVLLTYVGGALVVVLALAVAISTGAFAAAVDFVSVPIS